MNTFNGDYVTMGKLIVKRFMDSFMEDNNRVRHHRKPEREVREFFNKITGGMLQ